MKRPEMTRDYLAALLRMDPHTECEAIVARRRAFLRAGATPAGPEPSQAPDPARAGGPREAMDREAARAALDALRRDFWTREPGSVRRELDALELERFPDLERTARRFRIALEVRDRVLELERDPGADRHVVRYLKTILVAPRRDQARLRQQAARKLLTGAGIKAAQATEKLVRRRYPEIRALAPEWFEEIRRAPRERRSIDRRVDAAADVDRVQQGRGLVRRLLGRAWWIVILVYILLRILASALRNS
jgi:hypothetical protein